MRKAAIGVFFAVAACAPPQDLVPVVSGAGPAEGAAQAYFKAYPGHFFEAAAAVCTQPGQELVRPDAHEVRCESFPTPEVAAALILQFDGTVEALPQFVIAFRGANDSAGYLVTADSYIRVPQKSGTAQQLRFPDDEMTENFKTLLEQAGGRPL